MNYQKQFDYVYSKIYKELAETNNYNYVKNQVYTKASKEIPLPAMGQ